jgi:hypothetical protein
MKKEIVHASSIDYRGTRKKSERKRRLEFGRLEKMA